MNIKLSEISRLSFESCQNWISKLFVVGNRANSGPINFHVFVLRHYNVALNPKAQLSPIYSFLGSKNNWFSISKFSIRLKQNEHEQVRNGEIISEATSIFSFKASGLSWSFPIREKVLIDLPHPHSEHLRVACSLHEQITIRKCFLKLSYKHLLRKWV